MFQLERLNVVSETLSQILREMYDERIETTTGMLGKATDISCKADEIARLVSNERDRRGDENETC